jgi:hypothetical protein
MTNINKESIYTVGSENDIADTKGRKQDKATVLPKSDIKTQDLSIDDLKKEKELMQSE